MKLFEQEFTFDHPWSSTVDYLNRELDSETGILRSERIISCEQNLPHLVSKFLPNRGHFHEVSEVDPENKTFTIRSTNLNYNTIIRIEETCVYKPDPNDAQKTLFTQSAKVTFSGFQYVANSIEDHCINRFRFNSRQGRAALEQVLDRLKEEAIDSAASLGIPLEM